MRRKIVLAIAVLMFNMVFFPAAKIMASSSTVGQDSLVINGGSSASTAPIVLDGYFNDWYGKPFTTDDKRDTKTTWIDFLGVGYFTDNNYLYLRVTRLSAEKSGDWIFYVVMNNAVKGTKIKQEPPGMSSFYAPEFKIVSHYGDYKSSGAIPVDVYFEGERLETTFSAADTNKDIEFRIPLAKVGLDGLNKEIKFMLKSSIDEKTGIRDWIPSYGPITITTGPTFYELSTAVFFTAVSIAAYRKFKK